MEDFEDLFGLIMVVLAAVSALQSKKKKKAKKQAMKQVFDQPAKPKQQSLEQTMMQWFEQPRTEVEAPKAPIPAAEEKPAEIPIPAVMGSLGEDTHEGKHPCDDENHVEPAKKLRPQQPIPAASSGLQLDWTGENMVKAFVMQEVLTRPSQRRRA